MNLGRSVSPLLADAVTWARGLRSRPWLLGAAAVVVVVALMSLIGPTPVDPARAPASGADSRMSGASDATTGTGLTGIGSESPETDLADLAGLATKGVLVLALLLITLRVLRRVSSGTGSASARIVVLETRPLAQRATLHLVAIGERRLVLGLTPTGLVSLAELSADELPEDTAAFAMGGSTGDIDPSGTRPTERFGRVLAELVGRRSVAP